MSDLPPRPEVGQQRGDLLPSELLVRDEVPRDEADSTRPDGGLGKHHAPHATEPAAERERATDCDVCFEPIPFGTLFWLRHKRRDAETGLPVVVVICGACKSKETA